MMEIIGVRFKSAGKIYYFDPDGNQMEKGGEVIVETARGVEYGFVEIGNKTVNETEVVQPLKKVLRMATEEDRAQEAANRAREKEAVEICAEKIIKHKLDMKLIDVELTFDQNKIIFYFTADGRVDFRELVKELAGVFRMRIELRQIGVRDEAKLMNGIGSCGRTLCCATFLDEFHPVSIKMAKEQNLSLNPTKISGICGRLMCCLKYEEETYEYLNRNLPNEGETVQTPDGPGEVLTVSVLRQLVRVAVRKKPQDAPVVSMYSIDELNAPSKKRGAEEEEAFPQVTYADGETEKPFSAQSVNRPRNDRRSDRSRSNGSRGDRPERGSEQNERNTERSDRNVDRHERNAERSDRNADRHERNAERSDRNADKQERNAERSDRNADKQERNTERNDRNNDRRERNNERPDRSSEKRERNANKRLEPQERGVSKRSDRRDEDYDYNGDRPGDPVKPKRERRGDRPRDKEQTAGTDSNHTDMEPMAESHRRSNRNRRGRGGRKDRPQNPGASEE